MASPARFETFQEALVISGTLSLKTQMHIGQGRSMDPLDCDLPVIKGPGRQPFIPGSSLRGVLRSGCEMVLRGMTSPEQAKRVACFGPDDKKNWCCAAFADGLGERARELTTNPELFSQLLEESCLVCNLFGNPWMGSRLVVEDAPLCPEDSPSHVTRIKDGIRIDRNKGTVADGAKFDYEVVESGTSFSFALRVINPLPEDLGILLVALDLLDAGILGIGGKRAAGLGQVNVSYDTQRLTLKNLLEGSEQEEISGETLANSRKELISKVKSLTGRAV